MEPRSPALQDSLPSEAPGKPSSSLARADSDYGGQSEVSREGVAGDWGNTAAEVDRICRREQPSSKNR